MRNISRFILFTVMSLIAILSNVYFNSILGEVSGEAAISQLQNSDAAFVANNIIQTFIANFGLISFLVWIVLSFILLIPAFKQELISVAIKDTNDFQ